MQALISRVLGGALGGILVLLVVFALSWVTITHRVSKVEKRVVGSPGDEKAEPAKYEMVKEEEGEDRDEEDEAQKPLTDWEAAHVAAEIGDLAKFRLLILERGVLVHVDAEDQHAMTLLQVASRYGHLELVQFLIDNYAAVNATKLDDRAALHFAVICGHISIAEQLLEHGADANLRKKTWTHAHARCSADIAHRPCTSPLGTWRGNGSS